MLGEFIDIYFVLGQKGFAPPVVDDWYVWQVAAVLGVHRPEDDDTPVAPVQVARAGGPGGPDAESLRLIAARAAYRDGKGPKPEAPAYAPDQLGFAAGAAAAALGSRVTSGDH